MLRKGKTFHNLKATELYRCQLSDDMVTALSVESLGLLPSETSRNCNLPITVIKLSMETISQAMTSIIHDRRRQASSVEIAATLYFVMATPARFRSEDPRRPRLSALSNIQVLAR